MCAAMPAMPVDFTLPLTEPSPATVIVPLPDATVFTGGTSSPPESLRSAATARLPSIESASAGISVDRKRGNRWIAFIAACPGSLEELDCLALRLAHFARQGPPGAMICPDHDRAWAHWRVTTPVTPLR